MMAGAYPVDRAAPAFDTPEATLVEKVRGSRIVDESRTRGQSTAVPRRTPIVDETE